MIGRPVFQQPIFARRNERYVNSERELLVALADIGNNTVTETGRTIVVNALIPLTRPIVLSAVHNNMVLRGAGRGCGFSVATGRSLTELFQASGITTDLVFSNLDFRSPTVIGRVMSCNSGTFIGLVVTDCNLSKIERFIQSDGSTPRVLDSVFRNLGYTGLQLSDTSDIGSAEYDRCLFEQCWASLPSLTFRRVAVSDQVGSGSNVCIQAGPTSGTSDIHLNTFATSQVYGLTVSSNLAVSGNASVTGDATFSRFVVQAPTSITLNSANPTLTPTSSFMKYSVGASGTGNIFIANGTYDGQELTLWCAAYAGTAIFSDSTANSNCRLVGNFTPTVRSTLRLIWESGDDAWQEISRANT